MLVNPRINELYPSTFEKTIFKREEKKDAFTTSTGIKVFADIVNTSQRGAKQEEARPDFIWFNDFESKKTLKSAVLTKTIWDNMEEARTGLELGGGCVYTCNYISEAGNVHRLIKTKLSPRKKIMIVPIERNGIPTWPRYTVENIEAMRKTDDDFEGERMCRPSASKDIYVERERLEKMPILKPIKEIAGFKIFKEYNALHRIGSGHDVAGGLGLDSSTSVFIDFDTIPAQVVGTFHSNTILPEAFGVEVYNEGNIFGGCIQAIENNKYDQTILKAKQLGSNLYMQQPKAIKAHLDLPTIYGYNTNSLTKSKCDSDLKEAIESGLLELNDENLIEEAKGYTKNDVIDKEPDPRMTTRHFDLWRACAIAWQMKDWARKKKQKTNSGFGNQQETNPAI
jgi:hypothetical protein